MARHKDIDRAHADFKGHGFHISYHPESIIKPSSRKPKKKNKPKRRNKKRCIYYDRIKNYCIKLKRTCITSSDCASYRD